MNITTVGIDLAKNLFQVHAVDARGKLVLRKQLRRAQVAVFFANLPPCLIGMEACASAHHWGRTLERFGHTVRLMASQFVKPYVKTNKNDAADAEAICEAVGRQNMRFVPIKSVEQQAILSVHRVRQGFVKARTAQANQIRGLLGEFGLVIPQGIYNVAKRVPELLEDASNELPVAFRQLVERLTEHLKELDRQVKDFEQQIIAWHRSSDLSRKLENIPGIGPLAASALVASIADARSFDNGRQVSAWLGLVPRQHSSSGKPMLLGMSKRGDAYLRTLLIHGARRVGDTGPRARVPGRLCADPNGRIVGSFTDQNDRTGEHTTDCSGDHAVMAQQVGPWLVKPRMTAAPRVRVSDREPISQTQGTAAQAAAKVRMYGCNLILSALMN
jgi:transposase